MKKLTRKSLLMWGVAGGTGALLLAAWVMAGPGSVQGQPAVAIAGPTMPYDELPPEMTLQATIRDFRGSDETGGHPDFETFAGPRATVGLLSDQLGDDGKPIVVSLMGSLIDQEYTNAAGEAIGPAMFDPSKGDKAGSLTPRTSKQITSLSSFNSWYNDVAGTNISKPLNIILKRTPGSPVYVFDSATDSPYLERGGFFPIDKDLYGDYDTWGHNFHFTTEVAADFVYEKGKGHMFKFTGDDDLWVYIGGHLVMDLGGLHPRREQVVELDRLTWLTDGEVYQFKIFHAERHTVQSNFRIETTILFRLIAKPPVSNLWD